MTEARPLLSCECVECPSHRAEREQREVRVAALMATLHGRGVMLNSQSDEIDQLQARVAVLTAALRQIKERPNQVCGDFELCTHVGCASSYEAFAIADQALDAAAGGA